MGLSSKVKGALWFPGITLGQQRRFQEGGGIHVKRENGQDLSAFIGMIFILKWGDSQYCIYFKIVSSENHLCFRLI